MGQPMTNLEAFRAGASRAGSNAPRSRTERSSLLFGRNEPAAEPYAPRRLGAMRSRTETRDEFHSARRHVDEPWSFAGVGRTQRAIDHPHEEIETISSGRLAPHRPNMVVDFRQMVREPNDEKFESVERMMAETSRARNVRNRVVSAISHIVDE